MSDWLDSDEFRIQLQHINDYRGDLDYRKLSELKAAIRSHFIPKRKMEKIKLPWRRFGDEKPKIAQHLLIWDFDASLPSEGMLTENDQWYLYYEYDCVDEDKDCNPDDRWIYLSEIANPFEEEK